MRLSRRSLVALLGLVILGNGCDEPTRPPASGAIMVKVDEEGTDVPQLGYRSAVDNGPARALDSPGPRTTFTNIEPGAHTVRLEGLAPNCAVVGQNPMSVAVVSNQTAIARFNVSCVAHVGNVRVTTVTTGGDQDPNGYLVMVDGVQRTAVGVNATVAISAVRVGLHAISLGDIAPNCTVAAPHQVNVNVAFQGTVEARFDIQCVAAGTLQVTVATTGVDFDPNGYMVGVQAASVGFTGSLTVTPNGSVTFASLRPAADYRVTLQGVAENCDVVGADVQTVTVTAGTTTSVTFDVACVPVPLLAFVRDGDILAIALNGTGPTRLTTDPSFDGDPAWSSTGRIAFTTRRQGNAELYVMNADGTTPVRLTMSAGDDDTPSWSPNGGKIVFRSLRDVNSELYVVNADGTGLTRLTNNTAEDYQPAWSSTGKIAFVSDRDHSPGEIYVMNEDGSNVVRITNNDATESGPAWSPDGSVIAFARFGDCSDFYYWQYCEQDLLVMNADGSNERLVVIGHGRALANFDPSWSPSGDAIAFTQVYCPFYCDPPSVRIVDVDGAAPVLVATHGANPAWKP